MEKISQQVTIPDYCVPTALYKSEVEQKKGWAICQEAKKSRNLNFETHACSEKRSWNC